MNPALPGVWNTEVATPSPFSVEEIYEVEARLIGVPPDSRRPELKSALRKVEHWREETETERWQRPRTEGGPENEGG